jgi:hypothetical protein
VPDDTQLTGEGHNAAPTVPAHASLFSISIVVAHPEIHARAVFQDDQPVGTNTETPVAQPVNLGLAQAAGILTAAIHHNEVVARAVVFVELNIHGQPWLKKVKRPDIIVTWFQWAQDLIIFTR